MDVDALAQLAKKLTREQFVASHPSSYLVIAENAEKLPIGFETLVGADPGRREPPEKARDFEVLAVAKARGNPYPERISVGRARNCDVVMRDPSVSKLHAHFHVTPAGALELVDLESQNGTYINGRALAPHHSELVVSGDLIDFGDMSARLVDAAGLYDLLR
jgi:hypothetical protein